MKNIFKVSACIFALSLFFTLYGCKGSGDKGETTTEFVFRPFVTGDEFENTSGSYNSDNSETNSDADTAAGTDSDTEVFDDGFVAGGKIMLGGNKNKDNKTESSSQKESGSASGKKSDSSEKSSGNKSQTEKPGENAFQKKNEKNNEKNNGNVTESTTEKTTQTEPESPESDNRWGGLTWN